MLIAAGAGVAVVVLATIANLLRRRKRKKTPPVVTAPVALAAGQAEAGSEIARTGSNLEQQIESKLAEREALEQRPEAQALNSLKLAPAITKTAEVLAKHLREKIKQDPDMSAQILKAWIREEEN